MSKKRERPSHFRGHPSPHQVAPLDPGEEFTPIQRERLMHEPTGDELLDDLFGPEAPEDARTDAVKAVTQIASPWDARWVIGRRDGRLLIRALHLEASTRETPDGGITAELLRGLSPATALAAASGDADGSFTETMIRADELMALINGPRPAESRVPTKRGRPPVSDAELARVALAYLEELKHGPGVTRRLIERLDMPASTVRDRIRMCRDPKRGFLTQTDQGRRGGDPGPRLLELLAKVDEEKGRDL